MTCGQPIGAILLLAGCVSSRPASIAGEGRVFEDPGFVVRGATPRDQRRISRTQEADIASCGWKRPARDNH